MTGFLAGGSTVDFSARLPSIVKGGSACGGTAGSYHIGAKRTSLPQAADFQRKSGSQPNKKAPFRVPFCLVGLDGLEPSECHSQSVVPYHLATAQYKEKRLFVEVFFLSGVDSGIRTHGLQCHKLTR